MGKLKVKDIEGDSKDIQALFKESDCNLSSYIGAETFRGKIHYGWILLLTVVLFILSCCIWTNIFDAIWVKVAILGIFFLEFLIMLVVYFNYRSKTLTTIVGAGLIVITLLILNVYSPEEIAKRIGSVTLKEYNKK